MIFFLITIYLNMFNLAMSAYIIPSTIVFTAELIYVYCQYQLDWLV